MEPEKAIRYRREVIHLLWLISVVYGVSTTISAVFPRFSNLMDFIYGPCLVATGVGWQMYDAYARGETSNFSWTFGIFLLLPIVLPLYFYTTYGFKGGNILLLKTMLVLFISVIAIILGSLIGELFNT